MTVWEWFQSEKGGLFLAGAAGAAVGAAADWKGWKRAIQHFIVGVPCAYFGSDVIYAIISRIISMDYTPQTAGTAGFIAGAFGIVLIQFLFALFRHRQPHDDEKTD